MKPYTCRACLKEDERYLEAPAIDSACLSCGELAPQLERVLAGLLQVLDVTPASSPDSAVWTIEETAKELGCHPATVYRLLKQGKLKAAKKAGEKRMVFRSSVYAFRGDARAPKAEAAPSQSPAAPSDAPRPDYVSPLRALLKKPA